MTFQCWTPSNDLHFRVSSLYGLTRPFVIKSPWPLSPVLLSLPLNKSIPVILSFLLFFKHVRHAPQGLCICFLLCMETLPPDIHMTFFLTAFRSLLKSHFLSEAFPEPLFKTASLSKSASPVFWLWFFYIVLDTIGYNIWFSLFEHNCFLPLSTRM